MLQILRGMNEARVLLFFIFLVFCSTYLRTTEISNAAYLKRSHSNGDKDVEI